MSDAGFEVLCQVCGTHNAPEAEYCVNCNAALEITFRKKDEVEQLEAALKRMPPDEAAKARELEARLEAGETKPALFIQLATLYRSYHVTDRAIATLTRATELMPDNQYLKQRLDLLLTPKRPDEGRLARLEEEERQVTKWVKVIYAGFGLLVIWALYFLLVTFVRPSTYRVAYSKDNTLSIKFSPDGKRLAFMQMPKVGLLDFSFGYGDGPGTIDSRIMVAGPRGQEPKVVTEFSSMGGFWGGLEYHWIPRSNQIAYIETEKYKPYIYTVDFQSGEETKLVSGSSPTFSYDGNYMAYLAPPSKPESDRLNKKDNAYWWLSLFGEEENCLWLMDLSTNETQMLISGNVRAPDFSPNNLEIVYEKEGKKVEEPAAYYDPRMGEDFSDWWSDQDSSLAVNANIFKYNLNNSMEYPLTKDNLSTEPRWTPDGGHICYKYFEDPEDYRNVLMLMDAEGKGARQLLGQAPSYESFGRISFSHDGKLLAFEAEFVNPDRPNLPTHSSPLGMIGGGLNIQSDIFTMQVNGIKLKRLEGGKHKFKSNPHFHPKDYRMAYEITMIDNKKEAWVTKVKP